MKTDDIKLYAGLTVLVFFLWAIISNFTSMITSAIIVAVICILFAIRYRYEGRHDRAYKRRLKMEAASSPQVLQSAGNVDLSTTAGTIGQDQAEYTGEDGYTYKRISEYELRGLFHRGADANAFIDSLRYKTKEELEDVVLYLLREPNNEYDQWAIKVLNCDGLHIGYVQREASEYISKVINDGKYLEARFTVVTYSDIKMRIFHHYYVGDGCGDDDEMDELMDYDRIAELEQKYLEEQRIKAELEQQKIRKKRAEARRAERLRKQEYIGYELEAENKIEEAIAVLSRLVDQGIVSHSAHHRLCIMLRKTKCYEDELWAAEKWLELTEKQRQNNIDVTTEIIKVKRRITKIHTLMGGE